jgi:DUF1009 family protein
MPAATMTTPMQRAESKTRFQLPAGGKIGIVAGGGTLPVEVARAAEAAGYPLFVMLAKGETEPDSPLLAYEHDEIRIEDFGRLCPRLRQRGVTHLVLAGEIRRRPRLTALRPSFGLLAMLPTVVAGLTRGDDSLLKMIVGYIESQGIKVLGAHEIVPDLLTRPGPLTKTVPRKSDWRDIEAARQAALAIGALDIGQAAVAIGGRAIALEGIEGTHGLLERVKDLRGHGRLAGKTGGALVKCVKPGQELRADLPSIGPQTIETAHQAGLAGIGVDAGRSLILDGPTTIARANALGLFVVGLTGEGGDGR